MSLLLKNSTFGYWKLFQVGSCALLICPHPFWSISFVLAPQYGPSWPYVFSATSQESTTFLQSFFLFQDTSQNHTFHWTFMAKTSLVPWSLFFFWEWYLESIIWMLDGLIITKASLFLGILSEQRSLEIYIYIYHAYTHIYIYLSLSIHVNTHTHTHTHKTKMWIRIDARESNQMPLGPF